MIISSLSRESERVTIIYYYWDCRVQEQTSVTFVGSLVTQLISAGHAVLKRLEALYNENSLRTTHLDSRHFRVLADIFFGMAAASPQKPLFIVVDALNEVPNAQWKEVTEFLHRCITHSHPSIKVVATTRPTTLQHEDNVLVDNSDLLKIEASEDEMKSYVDKALKDVKLDPERKVALVDSICAHSGGL